MSKWFFLFALFGVARTYTVKQDTTNIDVEDVETRGDLNELYVKETKGKTIGHSL